MKLVFTPISMAAGLAAGLAAKKLFERIWARIDDAEPPSPEQQEVNWPKLITALVIEGAVFRLVKGLADHGARELTLRYAGAWPGEEKQHRDG